MSARVCANHDGKVHSKTIFKGRGPPDSGYATPIPPAKSGPFSTTKAVAGNIFFKYIHTLSAVHTSTEIKYIELQINV